MQEKKPTTLIQDEASRLLHKLVEDNLEIPPHHWFDVFLSHAALLFFVNGAPFEVFKKAMHDGAEAYRKYWEKT